MILDEYANAGIRTGRRSEKSRPRTTLGSTGLRASRGRPKAPAMPRRHVAPVFGVLLVLLLGTE